MSPRAVAFAYGAFGRCGLEALVRAGAELPLVVSHADRPGEQVWWPSVHAFCAERGIPLLLDPDLRDPAAIARIAEARPDFLFSFYFRQMIPERVLSLAPQGGWNLHGSLLPRYRGRAPLNWQLVHGETRTGLTLHRMVRRADAGGIVAQIAVDIGPDDDAWQLAQRLSALAPGFLDGALPELLAGRAVERVQDERLATVFGGRTPADGAIDWSRPARAIHNLVRAVTRPFPGASTALDGRPVLLWRTRVAADHGVGGAPGAVRPDRLVACGDGLVEILAADDAAGRAFTPEPGMRFSEAPRTAQKAHA